MSVSALPPLSALRAFAAYCETGSVQKAGAMLNVTHAAISQQLRALEGDLGVTLLDRSARSMALTAEGRDLAHAVNAGFGQIAEVVTRLTGAEENRPLHVATTPMFAAAWLMPQLAGFHAAHPDIDLILSTTPEVQPLEPGGIDIALRYGAGDWPGLESRLLFRSPMVVVAAPSLVGKQTFKEMAELSHLPWLQDIGVSEASEWIKAEVAPGGTVSMLPGNLLLDGTRDGQGVAVAIRAFVQRDLDAGRLRELFTHADPKAYHIVTRPGVQRKAAKNFIRWLGSLHKPG